jgi:hypothetical protein
MGFNEVRPEAKIDKKYATSIALSASKSLPKFLDVKTKTPSNEIALLSAKIPPKITLDALDRLHDGSKNWMS